MYCSQCGQRLPDGARFCPRCGAASLAGTAAPLPPAVAPSPGSVSPASSSLAETGRRLAQHLSFREELSCIFWTCIAVYQLFIGIRPGRHVVLFIAAWNALGIWSSYQHSKQVRTPYNGMIERYENGTKSIIALLVANLLIGALIGVIPAVYDLFTRNFVLKNRDAFRAAAAENCAARPPENNIPPQ